jgi:hypothetical protein
MLLSSGRVIVSAEDYGLEGFRRAVATEAICRCCGARLTENENVFILACGGNERTKDGRQTIPVRRIAVAGRVCGRPGDRPGRAFGIAATWSAVEQTGGDLKWAIVCASARWHSAPQRRWWCRRWLPT